MKKKFLSLLLTLLACLPLILSAGARGIAPCVSDEYLYLNDSEWEDLEYRAQTLSQKYDFGVYILVEGSYSWNEYNNVDDCAEAYYTNNNLGLGTDQDGVLLMLSMEEREFTILVHGEYGQYAFTDYGLEKMEEQFIDEFGDDEWYEGFREYLDQAEFYLKSAEKGKPYDANYKGTSHIIKVSAIAITFSVITACITCGIFYKQMNTAAKQTSASAYLTEEGPVFTSREDQYTHTTTTRVKIQSESSSGSSSKSSGGGFSSHSGKF